MRRRVSQPCVVVVVVVVVAHPRIRSIIQLEIQFHLRTFTIPSDCGSVNAQFRSSFTNE